jgi:hypothetical protein
LAALVFFPTGAVELDWTKIAFLGGEFPALGCPVLDAVFVGLDDGDFFSPGRFAL